MTEVKRVIADLRTTGRWHPLVRSVLLLFAVFAFTIVFTFPVVIVAQLLLGPGTQFEGSVALALGIFTQFLGALVAVWLFRRTLDRQSFGSLGLETRQGWLGDFVWGVGLGVGLMLFTVAILSLFGWIEFRGSGWSQQSAVSIAGWTIGGALVLLVGAFTEELVARGYLLQNVAAGSSLVSGVLVSSVLFGLAHLMNPESSVLAAVNTGLAGLLFALLYLWTDALWAPIGAHVAWNYTQNYVLGLPVSGLDLFPGSSPLLFREVGPGIATGGNFGPEGGIVVTVVLVAASAFFIVRLLKGQAS